MSGEPRERPVVESWVWTENLHPWLQILGRICGYGLDDLDWAMIDLELEATGSERDRWFDYRFVGDEQLDVSIAYATAEGVTSVKVRCPEHLRSLVELATHIANVYRVR